jgi:tetratricopeptide (TPR) repeat protein
MLDYRDALKRAPDYPLALFRAGHAHTVLGDYDLAVTYFGMGLELSRDTVRDGFTLDTLYKGDAISKQQHYGELGAMLRRQPQDGGLNYLMGMMLHYDGNATKAEEYFRKAVELPGRHRPYAAMYLPDEPPAPPVPAVPPVPAAAPVPAPAPAPPLQAAAVQAPLPQVPLQPAPAVQAPPVQAPPAVPQAAAPQQVKPAGAKPPVPRPVN